MNALYHFILYYSYMIVGCTYENIENTKFSLPNLHIDILTSVCFAGNEDT